MLFLLSALTSSAADQRTPRFAVATAPVPVLNTPDFRSVFGGKDGTTLAVDRCGQIRALEFIALPGTSFRIEGAINTLHGSVYRVTSDDYPYPSTTGYFIDSRMVRIMDSAPTPRKRTLPNPESIISQLTSAVGTPYQWGSNLRQGTPDMLSLYPPADGQPLEKDTQETWTLHGLDCSGLLYEATNGWTPRNTSELVGYGSPVAIAGLNADGIVRIVQPLDLIVWKGHVLIILDRERLIESRLDCLGATGGVKIRDLREALLQLLATRAPLNEYQCGLTATKGFVIRRWHSGVRPDSGTVPKAAPSPGKN